MNPLQHINPARAQSARELNPALRPAFPRGDTAGDTLFANRVPCANLANSDPEEATGLGAPRKVLLYYACGDIGL